MGVAALRQAAALEWRGDHGSDRYMSTGPMPPHGQFHGFLDPDLHQALLQWTAAREPDFQVATVTKSKVGHGDRLDSDVRIALRLDDLGPLAGPLSHHLLAALPDVMAAVGGRGPEPRSLELELTAYGDGAHFRPHLDIPVGQDRKPLGARKGEDRVISAVYYFHNQPKGFTGGRLKLFRFGSDPADDHSIAIEPADNSLVAFPSWAQHQVERVSCPSGNFADYRYAVNCWYCRPLDATKAAR